MRRNHKCGQPEYWRLVTYVFSLHGVTAAMLGGFAGLLGVKERESASIGWLLAAASSVLVFWGVAPVLMESMVHCVYGRLAMVAYGAAHETFGTYWSRKKDTELSILVSSHAILHLLGLF